MKKSKKSKDEEEELDEDLESEDELDLEEVVKKESKKTPELDFRDFEFHPSMNLDLNPDSGPVLERITSGFSGPRFFATAGFGQENENSVNPSSDSTYLPQEKTDETKYIGPGKQISSSPERMDFENVGKDSKEFYVPKQEMFFRSEQQGFESSSPERIKTTAERLDMENIGKNDFSEVGTKHYDSKQYEAHSK